MPKVKLEVLKPLDGLIKAPDFCPYKTALPAEEILKTAGTITTDYYPYVYAINIAVCAQCRMCEFQTVDPPAKLDNLPSETELDSVFKAITANKLLLESLMKQVHYLQRNDRLPIAAFISYNLLSEIIAGAVNNDAKDRVVSYFTSVDGPITVLAAIPLYFNRKLTKSGVQVVGEVEWQ